MARDVLSQDAVVMVPSSEPSAVICGTSPPAVLRSLRSLRASLAVPAELTETTRARWNDSVNTRVLGATVFAIAAFFVQCGGEEPSTTELPPVVYGGSASDEALERVWPKIATAEVSASSGAKMTSPAPGTAVPKDSPQAITWMIGVARREAPGVLPYASTAGHDRLVATGAPALPNRDPMINLYFGSALAEAHLPPVTGDVFLIELRTAANEENPLRVFTTDDSWFPDPMSWDRLKAAGGPITVKIYNAYVNKNVIEEGPYTRDDVTTFDIN